MNPYELKRLETIERNQQILKELNLIAPKQEKPKRLPRKKREFVEGERRSKRSKEVVSEKDVVIEKETLLTFDEYFTQEIRENALRVDGIYRGWLNPKVIQEHGLPESPEDCVDQPLIKMNRPKGWSKAKFDSYVGLRRNPNQYFYRHTAPGVEQSSGEWTSDEIDTFLKIAREFGCGDKFGLFASYLEHRVGYQVTAFYKSHFLSKGIIFDDNYRLNTQGTVVYVGK